MQGRYYHAGRTAELSPDVLGADEAAHLVRRLLSGTDDTSQMLVHDALIEAGRREDTAIEIVLPTPDSFDAGIAGRVRADRVFIPLTGRHALDGDAAAVFVGDGVYRRGPFHNPRGRTLLTPLLARAQARRDGG